MAPDDGDDSGDEAPRKQKLTMEDKAIFLESDALQIEMGNGGDFADPADRQNQFAPSGANRKSSEFAP